MDRVWQHLFHRCDRSCLEIGQDRFGPEVVSIENFLEEVVVAACALPNQQTVYEWDDGGHDDGVKGE